MNSKLLGIVAACGAVALTTNAMATLLVYEPFNYNLSNGANMHGVTATATGLTGNYAVSTTLASGGSASATYNTSGLSFGPLITSAGTGSVQLNTQTAGTGANNFVLAGASLNASHTGTLWHSHLFEFSSLTANDQSAPSAQVRINTGATAVGASSYLQAHSNASGGTNKPGVAYIQGSVAQSPGTTPFLATNTTYLAIARFTNVGVQLSSPVGGIGSIWVFDVASFQNWVTAGENEADLGTYAVWSTANTAPGVQNGNTYLFDTTRAMQLFNFISAANQTQTLRYDEIRYGTTLASVTPIPEPATLGLLGLGGLLMLRRRRIGG